MNKNSDPNVCCKLVFLSFASYAMISPYSLNDATNKDELTNFEYFAHGAANAMWELGIFTQAEHTANFDRIAAVTEQKLKGWGLK